MFGEDHRLPSKQAATQHRLKKRRVLMSVKNPCTFAIGEFPDPPCTATIDPGLPMQMLHDESVSNQAFADFAELIQHCDDAAKFVAQQPDHLIDQDFRPANSQRMNDVADRGTVVDRCDAEVWW